MVFLYEKGIIDDSEVRLTAMMMMMMAKAMLMALEMTMTMIPAVAGASEDLLTAGGGCAPLILRAPLFLDLAPLPGLPGFPCSLPILCSTKTIKGNQGAVTK